MLKGNRVTAYTHSVDQLSPLFENRCEIPTIDT